MHARGRALAGDGEGDRGGCLGAGRLLVFGAAGGSGEGADREAPCWGEFELEGGTVERVFGNGGEVMGDEIAEGGGLEAAVGNAVTLDGEGSAGATDLAEVEGFFV